MFPGSIAILSVVVLVGGNRRTRKKTLREKTKTNNKPSPPFDTKFSSPSQTRRSFT